MIMLWVTNFKKTTHTIIFETTDLKIQFFYVPLCRQETAACLLICRTNELCSPSHSQGFSSVTRSSWSTRAACLGGPLPRQWRQHFHGASQTAWKRCQVTCCGAKWLPHQWQHKARQLWQGDAWGKWLSVPSPSLILTCTAVPPESGSFLPQAAVPRIMWALCTSKAAPWGCTNPIIMGSQGCVSNPRHCWGKGRQARAATSQCHTKIDRGQNTSHFVGQQRWETGKGCCWCWCQSPAHLLHTPL